MRKLFCVMLFSLIIVLSGCSGEKKNKGFLDEFKGTESYTMVTTLQVPIFGKMESINKVDGDKEYVSNIEEEYYLSKENGTTYKYVKNGETWSKETYVDEEENDEDQIDPAEFKNEWFKKEDDKYILKEEHYEDVFGEEYEDVRKFEITVNDNQIKIDFEVNSEGFLLEGNIVIKNLGSTTVELPKL